MWPYGKALQQLKTKPIPSHQQPQTWDIVLIGKISTDMQTIMKSEIYFSSVNDGQKEESKGKSIKMNGWMDHDSSLLYDNVQALRNIN